MAHFTPTPEQQECIDAFNTGDDLVIEALAGAGKTETLRLIGEAAIDSKGLYLAYNKAIQLEAERRFPKNVTCKTSHGLAWGNIIKYQRSPFGVRLANSERMPTRIIAEWFGINKPYTLKNGVELSEIHLARLVMDTIRRFCNSSDLVIKSHHVPHQDGLDSEEDSHLNEMILSMAKLGWGDIMNPEGTLQYTHDHYLKQWALTEPQLEYDFVLLDEAQDTNPVVQGVFESQLNAQKVMVGDANQAIYGWRGAMDAMSKFTGTRKYLTQSFRFGDAVANEANKFLRLLESPALVRGFDKVNSTVEYVDEPDVILCRTNGDAVRNVMEKQANNIPVALVGGGREIESFAFAALDLMKGKRPNYAPLVAFKDWSEVLDYVENDEGGSDLKVNARLVRDWGAVQVIDAMKKLYPEKDASIIISTAHRSKGREWDKVKIGSDFASLVKDREVPSQSELMLCYVAVTRAKNQLDMGGLSWVDRFGKE